MLAQAALLALLGTASAEAPLATPAGPQGMNRDLQHTYESGARQVRVGQVMYQVSSVGSLAGFFMYYLAPDARWQQAGAYTMAGSTVVGLVGTPFAVMGANRAAGAVVQSGLPVRRATGYWSIALLGLSAGAVGSAWALQDDDPLLAEISLYLGWTLASTSFKLALRQLGEAEWALNRKVLWTVAPTGHGAALVVRF